jgi:hypothetical protein
VLGPFMIIRFVSIMLLAVLAFSIIIYRSIPYEVRSRL